MRKWLANRLLTRFSARYDYDVSYMRAILDASPPAFFKFGAAMRLSRHREAASVSASFAAKLVGAAHEDCGPCVQIVVDMAREAGVADATIDAVLRRDITAMGEEAALAFRFADAIVRKAPDGDDAREAVRRAWGDRGVVDLTFALQYSRIYPMVKAGLGYAKSCARVTVGERIVAVAKAA